VTRAAALATVVLAATTAHAAGGDYRLDSREWNGLGRLVEEANAAGCTIAATETLDWSALEARDVVWFVYPRTAVDGATLRKYLEAGGRAVIADDFGASDAALAALDIRRLRGELPAVERYDGNAALPIARQTKSTELSVGIVELVANHPAFFSSPNEATYEFAPGAALVIEGRIKRQHDAPEGYFVAIADPSILINNMLDIDGNLAFARALVKRTCKPGDRIHLVTQSFMARGEPSGELAPPSLADSLFVKFNRMLESIDELIHAALYGRMAGIVDVLCAVAALLLFWRAWPARGRIDGDWTRAATATSGWRTWDAVATATFLRDEVALRLSEALGATITEWTPAELRRRATPKLGEATAELAASLWTQLRRVPPWIGGRRLHKLHDGATSLFDALAERRET
jgi:uncharacterized protein DUF4350